MNFDIKLHKMLASNIKYNTSIKNQVIQSTSLVTKNYISKTKIIDNILPNIYNNVNTWLKVLPTSCKFTPLYFTPSYPWTYRMSAKINNYFFGKKPIHNLLTFNLNLSTNHQLRGSYFFSNYDTTNYGKLDNKRIKLYRVYPSLSSANLIPSTKFIYQPPITNLNLAYLPLSKYDSVYNSSNKYSGNAWFGDPIVQAFSRKYHNIEPYNIMSKEIDSVVSMFDHKLLFIFNPLNAMYNLQRDFTLGLSPTSKTFIPVKYLRNNDIFSRRLSLWSQKYYSFWNKITKFHTIENSILLKIINKSMADFNTQIQISNNKHIIITNKLQNIMNKSNFSNSKKNIMLALLQNNYDHKLFNVVSYVNNLYNTKFPLSNIKNKLFINIKQGRSLISNLVFSTKNMAVISSRNLFHYYPYYTKKPYGTGLKQILFKKSNKFNKNKISMFNQILKLNHMSKYNFGSFSKMQQLSKWMPYNIFKHIYWSNQQPLLNVLSQINTHSLQQSKYTNKISHRLRSQHLMPIYNNWQKFIGKLNLYYYLLYHQYNLKKLNKLVKFNKKNKWFKNYKYIPTYINAVWNKETKNLYNYFVNKYWIISGLTHTKSGLINKKESENPKKSKKDLAIEREIKEMVSIIGKTKLNREIFMKYLTLEKAREARKLEQARIKQELRLQKQKQEQELRLQKQKQEQELRLQKRNLIWAEKKEKARLSEESKLAERIVVQVDLNVRLPSDVWASLTENQRIHYHMHQKKLRKIEKQKMVLSTNSASTPIFNNNKKI